MKAAFFHDSKFKFDKSRKYYTSGSLTAELFDRYLQDFSHLTVVTRAQLAKTKSEIAGYSLSSHKRVSFNCLKKLGLYSLLFGENKKHIKHVICKNDVSIVRMPSIIGIFACIESERSKRPYIIEMVACPWDALWNYGKLSYKIAAPILYIINRIILYRAKKVIYVTDSFLQQRYPTKGASISCSDVEITPPKETELLDRILRYEARTTNDPVSLVTIANTGLKHKGQQYVIESMKGLMAVGYKLDYYLIGAGDQGYLRELAKAKGVADYVHFLGPKPHDEIYTLLQEMDIYIQPSNQDATPRVIIEALSKACPIIGSSTGGIPEIIDKDYVFVRKDIRDLSAKITDMIDNGLSAQAKVSYVSASRYDAEKLRIKRSFFYLECLKSKVIR